MEHIPEHILNWMEQKSFSALTEEQQKDVLQYISEAEYNELHKAAIIAATYAKQNEGKIVATGSTLEHLHTVFDNAYPENKRKLQPILFWKVAASFLLLVSAVFSFGWYKAQHQKPEVVTHIITDTVFVDRAKTVPQEIKIYDTLYLEKQSGKSKRKLKNNNPKYSVSPYSYKKIFPRENQLNNIPFSDKDQPQNRQKNNSIKDDTLIQNFDFVQL